MSGRGHLKAISVREDRFLHLAISRDQLLMKVNSLSQICAPFRQYSSKRLHKDGMIARRSVTCPLLNGDHRAVRLQFALAYLNWTIARWTNVLFTNESQFPLQVPGGSQQIWGLPGERFAHWNNSPRILNFKQFYNRVDWHKFGGLHRVTYTGRGTLRAESLVN